MLQWKDCATDSIEHEDGEQLANFSLRRIRKQAPARGI